MSSAVRKVVTEALPNCTIETIESQNARPGNKTARVEFVDREPVYTKVDLHSVGRVCREIAGVRYAGKHASVNVPRIVAADPDADSPYMITWPLAGDLMNERWTTDDGDAITTRRH